MTDRDDRIKHQKGYRRQSSLRSLVEVGLVEATGLHFVLILLLAGVKTTTFFYFLFASGNHLARSNV
jgi:hypothetical protein